MMVTQALFGFQSRLHQVGFEVSVGTIKSIAYTPEKVGQQSRSLHHLKIAKRSPFAERTGFSGYIQGLCEISCSPACLRVGPEAFSWGDTL